MVEDDTFTYHIKQLPADRANTAVHSLITKERTQKLDLLIHLLSNLTQSLVVCGPVGIGKTTLLSLLQQRNADLWRYCVVLGNADVSFETLQKELIQATSDRQHKQTVLIIDNAGDLVPGLISAVIQHAAANPAFRVIFTLTHDELQVKRRSDKAIDDCHIVEIPTLSEKQCGDFLQHLSTKPALNLPFKAITENMIAHIYRETHGVPGRIINELSVMPRSKEGGRLKWIVAFTVVVGLTITFSVQWLSSNNVPKKIVEPVTVKQKADTIELPLPKPEVQVLLALPPVIQQQMLSQPKEQEPSVVNVDPLNAVEVKEQPKQSLVTQTDAQIPPAWVIKAQTESVSVAKIQQKPENKQSADAQVKTAERLWAKQEKLKQAEFKATLKPEQSAANNFTLQLMVLSKQASVNGILKKYPSITSGIRTIKTLVNGQEKFIIEYGSYPDAVSANKARQSLPAEFHSAMIRKIR